MYYSLVSLPPPSLTSVFFDFSEFYRFFPTCSLENTRIQKYADESRLVASRERPAGATGLVAFLSEVTCERDICQ